MHALERIPESRRGAVFAAHNLSREAFEVWAGINSGELPASEIDAMQVRLARWQVDRFGGTGGDVLMALGIVEELGETADAISEGFADVNGGAEQAVDGLGDVMVYASQLCTSNRLAIGPILDLARVYTKHESTTPLVIMAAAGRLSHVVLKHDQKIRGLADVAVYRVALVDALALCISKAIDECEMGHNLTVNAPGVLVAVGTEILERKQGDAMIPAPANRWECQDAGADHANTIGGLTLLETVAPEQNILRVQVQDPDRFIENLAGFTLANPRDPMEQLREGIEALANAEFVEGRPDFDLTDTVTPNLCPQCAGLLSHGGDNDVWVCPNGHDITGKQLATFKASSAR